jgi:hypothetical protein
MKIRNGFVSNSSSSSFICCLTGDMESGMDASASDLGFVECKNGHTFKEDLRLDFDIDEPTIDDYREWFKNSWKYDYHQNKENLSDEDFLEWFEEDCLEEYEDEGISPLQCPICQFEDLPFEDVAKYYLINQGLTRKEFAGKMKEQFGDYESFSKFIGDKK